MRKITSVIVSLALLSVMTMGYCSDTYADVVKSQSKDVNAGVIGDVDGPDVFSVDVSWGAMNFTYMKVEDTQWNPETHVYDKIGSYTYYWSGSGNVVTVVNHSNIPVEADLTYISEDDFDHITGKFTDGSKIKLPSAFGTDTSSKKIRATRVLKLSGHLKGDYEDYVDVGKIRVEIN